MSSMSPSAISESIASDTVSECKMVFPYTTRHAGAADETVGRQSDECARVWEHLLAYCLGGVFDPSGARRDAAATVDVCIGRWPPSGNIDSSIVCRAAFTCPSPDGYQQRSGHSIGLV